MKTIEEKRELAWLGVEKHYDKIEGLTRHEEPIVKYLAYLVLGELHYRESEKANDRHSTDTQ